MNTKEEVIEKLLKMEPALFLKVKQILARKSVDYNFSRIMSSDFKLDDSRKEYFRFEDASYGTMLDTKTRRIMNLIESKMKNSSPAQFESIEDSLVDLVSYACFYYSFLQDQKNAS